MHEGGDTQERRGVYGFYLCVEDSTHAVMRVAATKSIARRFAQEWTGPGGSNTRPAAEAPKAGRRRCCGGYDGVRW